MSLSSIDAQRFGEFNQKNQEIESDGEITLVAGVSGEKVKVYSFHLSAEVAHEYWLRSGSNIIQTFFISANSASSFFQAVDRNLPVFVTGLGEALTIQADSGADKASVYLSYKQEA